MPSSATTATSLGTSRGIAPIQGPPATSTALLFPAVVTAAAVVNNLHRTRVDTETSLKDTSMASQFGAGLLMALRRSGVPSATMARVTGRPLTALESTRVFPPMPPTTFAKAMVVAEDKAQGTKFNPGPIAADNKVAEDL